MQLNYKDSIGGNDYQRFYERSTDGTFMRATSETGVRVMNEVQHGPVIFMLRTIDERRNERVVEPHVSYKREFIERRSAERASAI